MTPNEARGIWSCLSCHANEITDDHQVHDDLCAIGAYQYMVNIANYENHEKSLKIAYRFMDEAS